MNCKLEQNTRRYNIFLTLMNGYGEGDFSDFFPYLRDDCRYVSMWVMDPLVGYEAVTDHLTGKGEAIKTSNSFPECTMVELVGNACPVNCDRVHINSGEARPGRVGLYYEDGKYCMLMEQTINDQTNDVLVDLTLDEQGMVRQLDLCDPALFNYEIVNECLTIFASYNDEDDLDTIINIREEYSAELAAFLEVVGFTFDADGIISIPMDSWCKALEKWNEFCHADSFDSAFESMTGVDYDSWTAARPDVLKRMVGRYTTVAKNRRSHQRMLVDLMEWTNRYRDDHDSVCVEGV